MRTSIVVERDGFLYVKDPYEASYSEPKASASVWPLGVHTSQSWLKPGDALKAGSPGFYYYNRPGFPSRCIDLPQGGSTCIAWVEWRTLKPPRASGWDYHNGE